jgi:hypothetical protein
VDDTDHNLYIFYIFLKTLSLIVKQNFRENLISVISHLIKFPTFMEPKVRYSIEKKLHTEPHHYPH